MKQTKIHFEDKGQDFTTWTVDETGLVIDCQPFQKSVWVGCWVNTNKIKVGDKLHFINRQDHPVRLNYRVTKVEEITYSQARVKTMKLKK